MMNQDVLQSTAVQGTLFAGLPDDAAASLLAEATSRQVSQGATLFRQGDEPDHLLQVVTGMVRITQISSEGTQTTLRLMGPGGLLGCVAVFQEFAYPATATALEDTVVLSWRGPQFRELMRRHPAIAENALRIVGGRAREMVQRVVETSGKRVEQRVAAALLRIAEQGGTRVADGVRVEFPITRDDLAEMAGATYFTISRTLSGWQRLGLVRSERQRITILSADRLSLIAEGSA